MKRYASIVGLFFLVVLPVRADETLAKPVTVPFELLKSGHMAVMVKVNDKGPYRVIFDTGAPVTLLNNKVAKESGLLKDVKRPAFTLFGSMGPVKVPSLAVGDVKAENLSAVVMDHPTVEALAKALGPLEGIVGFSFFARYKVTIDYQAKQMTFVPNGFEPPDAMQALMTMLMAPPRDKQPAKLVVPAAQWGLVVHKEAGDEEAGVTVKDVLPGGAAAAAGLRAGDRLLTLDGRWTDTVVDCYTAAAAVQPGRAAKVAVRRGGKEVELTVTPRPGL
jgi:hypothetical protein